MDEMNREQLEQQIGELQADIDSTKEQLDEIRVKLGKGPIADTTSSDDQASSETQATNAEQQDAPDSELTAQEESLFQELVAKQMKLAALQRQLNDVIAKETMDGYGKEE